MYIVSDKKLFDAGRPVSVNETASLHEFFLKQPVEYLSPAKTLFLEGDNASHVFEVLDGALRIFKIISDGRRIITGFLYPGDFVGMCLWDRYLYSAEAICGTTVRRLSRRQLDAAATESQRLRPAIFSVVSDEMAAAQDQMVLLSCKSAEERLCSFLLKFMRRNALPGERILSIELPMCRQDIADYLGMTIETVSRTVTKLIGRGALRIEDATVRHTITILKPVLLAQLAGDGDECDEEPLELPRRLNGRH
ncbi:helix-turn-helix domain-containing protein [Agrobacterium tumefaciens]|uniref:helix-turn-helix domain-containing protein n=1 Tax=Agrobacterium tumefaciens TaxID=358 RepID=UPI001572A4C4|nr:helix-turn-helix domain-containing protein [Agrobacterium tumefaciens]WCK68743.1 helix-turn-helix domain-containing protein [Agrobacterium tumefaciens]